MILVQLRSKLSVVNTACFVYIGYITSKRGCEIIADWFGSSSNHDNASITFLGYGDENCSSYKHCMQNSLQSSNVLLLKPVQPDALIQKLIDERFDYSIIFVDPSAGLSYKYCLPNKFFESIAAGIPIITHSGLAEVSRLVHLYDIGIVSSEFSIHALNGAIHKAKYADHKQMSRNCLLLSKSYSFKKLFLAALTMDLD